MRQRVLVTGAGGFLGRTLVPRMVAAGHQVIAVYRRRPEPHPEGIHVAFSDLGTRAELPDRLDAVVHLAAVSPGPGATVQAYYASNVLGTWTVLEHAVEAGASRFIFASSTSVYGAVSAPELDETTPVVAPDLYGTTKYLGEKLLAARCGRLAGLSLRLPGLIGPGARPNFLSQALKRFIRHEPVTAFHPDQPFNNAVEVGELAEFVLQLLEIGWSGYDCVTLGAARPLPVREVLGSMARAVGSRSTLEFEAPSQPSFTISIKSAVERYGYAPSPIRAMIERWAKQEIADAQ